jgi:hypothetical protein
MTRFHIVLFFYLGINVCAGSAKAQSLKPVLSLPLTLKLPSATSNVANDRDLIQSKDGRKKALEDFKKAQSQLMKANRSSSDMTQQIAILRQAANRLGPNAKLLAELTAAQVSSGISSSGGKLGKPAGNYRNHLLAAGNIAAKIDETTHEQTALFSVALWRKVEGQDAAWSVPPADARAQKKFSFFRAIIERQALFEWRYEQRDAALKKYRSLSTSLNASVDGAAVDLRILELEQAIYKQSKQLRRWQKSLIDTAKKYEDSQFLGVGQESKTKQVSETIATLHRVLMRGLIKEALQRNTGADERKRTLDAIELYLTTSVDNQEKESVRNSQGEIEYIADNHRAAAGIFAALATESEGPKALGYWRKAIRSQSVLAKWPIDPPWQNFPKADVEQRTVLIDMYRRIDGQQLSDWPTAAHIGLLLIANQRVEEAYRLWTDRLNAFPKGSNATNAVGWMLSDKISAKRWGDVESLGRIMVKSGLLGQHLGKTFRPRDTLGLGLLEGGLTSLSASDYKTAITKLSEYSKGWQGDVRHDEGMYHLALAYQGDRQFRQAVEQMVAFSKRYSKSKWREGGLINGANWTTALTWDEHVLYFLETHAKEFPNSNKSKDSLLTLVDLYQGRETYDSALRIISILLRRSDIDDGLKIELARRALDTAERQASPEKALNLSERMLGQFRSDPIIMANAYALKAKLLANQGNSKGVNAIAGQISKLDQSVPVIADMISEVHFLVAETLAKNQFKSEFFSLGSKDPKVELEKGYALFTKINEAYKSSCLPVKTSWCGPALHRSARVAEDFVTFYSDITIAKTLDPEIISNFNTRKKSTLESVDALAMEADEKSMEQANSGATNPEWTAAILWQNGGQWSQEMFSGAAATHFIQWQTR